MIACLFLYAVRNAVRLYLPPPELPLELHDIADTRSAALPENDDEDKLDLNTAGFRDLTALPGIGEKTAQAILALRESLGGFRYPEDLLLVHGIGAKKLDSIYDYVYVAPVQ